jgi:putative ABC transport system ATP-binding protein/lipoprotein-releasing system ATP-binding protein
MSAPLPSPAAAVIPFLRAQGVRRTYHVGGTAIEVLRGVDLTVQKGERVFLCGPSGAGKTTLLYVLGGLERPDAGSVFLEGDSIYGRSDSRQATLRNAAIGYIFQNYLLLPELTALENVCLPAMIGGHQAKARAAELLGKVGLTPRLHHLPAQLSGGEQQRVAIARSLINNPSVVFADEPTGNLDSKTGTEVMNLLLSVVADEGKTLMVVTHDTRLAGQGDRMLVLRDGMLVD